MAYMMIAANLLFSHIFKKGKLLNSILCKVIF